MRQPNHMSLVRHSPDLLAGLPGADLVARGLEDLGRGETESIEALLVLMAAPRMRPCGFPWLKEPADPSPELELRLYRRLGESGDEAPYGTYNSLRATLSSFLSALEVRANRDGAADGCPP